MNMRVRNISIIFLAVGIAVLGVHQYARILIFSKIADGALRLNQLDDFSDVFALSLIIILGSLILLAASETYLVWKRLYVKYRSV